MIRNLAIGLALSLAPSLVLSNDLYGVDAFEATAEVLAPEAVEAYDEDIALSEALQVSDAAAGFEASESAGVRELWGHFGSVFYPSTAAYMRLRNGSGAPLTAALKRRLRPEFGALVDQVVVSYAASMANQIGSGDYSVNLGNEVNAQCFGLHIYIAKAANPGLERQFQTLVHEMVHARQFVARDRSLRRMGQDYFLAYYDAGGDHAKNRLEDEARAVEPPPVNTSQAD